jgi:ribosome-associated protein YbcJ (S4-like RNA binding protein)
MYDPGKVETIRGQVVRVERFVPMQGMSAGIHLILRADKEEIPVHLGPAWYVERQDVKIEAGATVEIEGSRVNVAGTPAIIAAVVKRGDEVLRLRDQAGIPAWSGWRRR